MSWPALLRVLQTCWPRKVRLRLTLLYAGLFLLAGGALLGLTYGLVAASLPVSNSAVNTRAINADLAKLRRLCNAPNPVPSASTAAGKKASNPQAAACKRMAEYVAGLRAGAESQRDRALHSLLLYSLLGLGVMTVASGGVGWVISGRVLRPVRAITDTARRASEQHLGERIGMTGVKDELRELADTFDDMLDRLDGAFAAQRAFVANASHELRTPLTVMRTAIDVTLAKPGRTQAQLEEMAERVRRRIDAAERMIDGLLTLAVSDQGAASRELLDLSTLAADALDMAAQGVERLGLTVLAELGAAPTAGDPKLLERMVWNLVDNAVRHNEPGGWIRVTTGVVSTGVVSTGSVSTGSAPTGTVQEQVFIRVANSGSAVPAESVPAIFEPFRRLAGRTGNQDGVGLGLSIVRSVSTAHDARLDARPVDGGGLEVFVALRSGGRRPEHLG
jgi:signal transduction histidine kinase